MASELVTRLPLMQNRTHHTSNEFSDNVMQHHGTYVNPDVTSNLANPTKMDFEVTQAPQHGSTMGSHVNVGLSYAYNAGFRYQIRRPVESWKFTETRKQDGSVLYLCRVCSSSYKHKKSLNKHWKDKHSDVPRPEGSHLEDDEDDEDTDEDGQQTINGLQSDLENVENVPPRESSTESITTRAMQARPAASKPVFANASAIHVSKRISAPLRRTVHRPFHTARMSLAPSSSTRYVDEAHSSRLDPESRKRGYITPKVPSEYPNECIAAKRPSKSYHMNDAFACDNTMTGDEDVREPRLSLPVDGSHDRCIDLRAADTLHSRSDLKTDLGAVEQVLPPLVSETPYDETGIPTAINDSQPLDLSVLKRSEVFVEEQKLLENYSKKAPTEINRSLLIGLLQTAMNTLNAEAMTDEVSNTAAVRLSRTSASLLCAIGTLLVALVDECELKKRCETKLLSSPRNYCPSDPVGTGSPPQHCALMLQSSDPSKRPVHTPQTTHIMAMEHSDASFKEGMPITHGFLRQTSPDTLLGNTSYDTVHTSNGGFKGLNPYCSISSSSLVDCSQFNLHTSRFAATITQPRPSCIETLSTTTPVAFESNPETRTSTPVRSEGIKRSPPPHEVSRHMEHSYECAIVCPVCKFDARWFSELRAHMVNHSEHRMFGCCYCPYRAKWKWDVAKHMRRCPLGRHVAHWSNESMLRIVRYHAPPPGNILFNYFPQDGFPGVGIDQPPTPPDLHYIDRGNRAISSSHVSETNRADVSQQATCAPTESKNSGHTCLIQTPPLCSQHVSTVSEEYSSANQMPPILSRQDIPPSPNDDPPEDSPQALVIVDGDDEAFQRHAPYSVPCTSTSQVSNTVGIHQSGQMTAVDCAVPLTPEATSGLIFRLRKCSQCTFHSSDDDEFRTHAQIHERENSLPPSPAAVAITTTGQLHSQLS